MNRYILLVFCFLCSHATAQEEGEAEKPKPLDPGYMGVHGMVVVNSASKLYASHLPTYYKPHNAQIVYKLDSKNPELTFLVRDADLVTIKPQPFNLQRLIRGEEVILTVDVYMGHFERGGMPTYKDMEVTLSEQVYLRMLDDIEESSRKQKYDSVILGKGRRLLIHQIQKAPSYDHIVLFYENVNCVTEFTASDAIPSEGELINRLSFCGSMKPLYYETQDFRNAF